MDSVANRPAWYWSGCSRCGRYTQCTDRGTWPAANRTYYQQLCHGCWRQVNEPEAWEKDRLELVPEHST